MMSEHAEIVLILIQMDNFHTNQSIIQMAII